VELAINVKPPAQKLSIETHNTPLSPPPLFSSPLSPSSPSKRGMFSTEKKKTRRKAKKGMSKKGALYGRESLVYYVDDNNLNRRLMFTMFQGHGMKVVLNLKEEKIKGLEECGSAVLPTGESLVTMLENNKNLKDVNDFLIDCNLGNEKYTDNALIRELFRQMKMEGVAIPVVIVSGGFDAEMKDLMTEMQEMMGNRDCISHLDKPLTKQGVFDVLKKSLGVDPSPTN